MTKLLCILSFLLPAALSAQMFRPDRYGRVSNPKFLQLAKDRGYTLIGSFDTIPQTKQMAARMRKNSTWVYLDWNGKEYESYREMGLAYGFISEALYREWDCGMGMDYQMPLPVPYTKTEPVIFQKDNKSGLKLGSKIIVPAIYDNIRMAKQGNNMLFLIVKQKGLYGLCDYRGRKLTSIRYDYLQNMTNGNRHFAFLASKDSKQGMLSRAGTVTIPVEFDKIEVVEEDVLRFVKVQKGELFGAYDAAGKAIIPAVYEQLQACYKSTPRIAFHARKNGKYGVLSGTGSVNVPLEYDNQLNWHTGWTYIAFQKQGFGALDTNGKQILPPVYKSISHVEEGNLLLVTTKAGKTGVTDLNGRFVLDTVYDNYSVFGESLAYQNKTIYTLSLDRKDPYKTGLYDMDKRQFILPCEYMIEMNPASDPVMSKEIDGKKYYGLLSKKGKVVIEAKYTFLSHVPLENMLVLQQDGKYGVTDMTLKVLIPFQYESLDAISKTLPSLPKGFFIFQENGKNGLIDLKQQVIIPAKYDRIAPTRSGLMCTLGQQSFLLDFSGKVLISAPYKLWENTVGIFSGTDESGQKHEIDLYDNKQPFLSEDRSTRAFDDPMPPTDPMPPIPVENKVYSDVDIMAEFPGGPPAMVKYLKDNMRYPINALETGIEGKCYLRFVVEENGDIRDIKITRGVPDCPECDKEAKRLIETMPKWIPGQINGKSVPSYFDIPVRFQIQQ